MGGRVPCWQTPCLADTGVGTCTGKSSSCRSISTTCTENRMAFEQKISLSPFGPETSSVEHFCKTAVALSHHMTSTSATSGSCRSEMWAQSFFSLSRDREHLCQGRTAGAPEARSSRGLLGHPCAAVCLPTSSF